MAISKKVAAKAVKSVKASDAGKKKTAPAKKVATPKPAAKKAAPKPATKAAPKAPAPKKTVKKAAAKASPTPKTTVAPKALVKKSIAKTNNQKTVTKKNTKPAPTATAKTTATKKAAPVKKAAPAAPVKKATAKKAAPAPKEAPKKQAAAKATAKTTKKEAPVKATPAPKTAAKGKAAEAAKASAAKAAAAKNLPVLKSAPAQPKPTATPAARPLEKKPQVIIAHRKLENKSKKAKTVNTEPPASYHTEAYRSILDEPVQEVPATVYRYSDDELNEFKQLIQSRLDAARKELHYLQGLITHKDEAGTEDTENRFMNMEDGSGAMEREQLAQLASRQIQFMNHLEKALVRIENKTYGVCRVTGKLIDKARLRAVPHATLSIEAKNMMTR